MIQIITNGEALDLAPNTAFEIIIEQPILSEDQMPVPFSTSISFPKTQRNKAAFGFLDALMFDPQIKKLEATIVVRGITLFDGILEYESLEDEMISYSFVDKDINIDLTTKLYELEHLPSYNVNSKTSSGEFLGAVASEKIKLPLVLNKDMALFTEYSGTNISNTCTLLEKYRNYPFSLFEGIITPAVTFEEILSPFLEKVSIQGASLDFRLRTLAVLGSHLPVSTFDLGRRSLISLAEALPDIQVKDFLINTLKLLNATLYRHKGNFLMIQNQDVINSIANKDWTSKTSRVFSSSAEQPKGYKFGFANEEDSDEFNVKTVNTDENEEKIISIDYPGLLHHLGNYKEPLICQLAIRKDIYSAQKITLGTEISLPLIDLISHHVPNVEETMEDMYDSTVIFKAVPTIPVHILFPQDYRLSKYTFAAVIPFQGVGAARNSDCWIGRSALGQLSSEGSFLLENGTFSYDEIGINSILFYKKNP